MLFKMNVSGMRVPYNDRAKLLIEDNLPSKDPIIWFEQWFNEAKNNPEVVEPNAMCLATATKEGIPSARMILCKGFGRDGFKFFTHYTSRKGGELEENPNAALTFFWGPFSRSVRIEGSVDKLPMSEADDYFSGRPYASQIGALCSDQSKPLAGRQVLSAKEQELKATFKEGQVPKPQFWGGYIVKPKSIEFWQGQTDRIHDRIKFYQPQANESPDNKLSFAGEDGWLYQRLAP